jgi:hypothetical protein
MGKFGSRAKAFQVKVHSSMSSSQSLYNSFIEFVLLCLSPRNGKHLK